MHTDQTCEEASRHKCLIYEGEPKKQFPVVIPFIVQGLEQNWRCLYLGEPEMVDAVRIALLIRNIDVSREIGRGALVLSSDRTHLGNGTFHAEEMIASLSLQADNAVRDGYQGLCATGDMKWEFGSDHNFDKLLEYEALLEQVLRDKPVRALCQYHRDILPAKTIHDALLTHRSLYVGAMLNSDNFYYVPPEILLKNQETASQGEWMCQQLLRVLTAEEKRDHAMAALRDSEDHERRLAEQLAEANRNLERRVAERTRELNAANQDLEAFSYSVSHDLRRPLQGIQSCSEFVSLTYGSVLGEKGRAHLDDVCTSVLRMGQLIDGLLKMGHVLKTELRRSQVDLTSLARSVMKEVRDAEPFRCLDLVIHDGLTAAADPVLLRAVLTNLLANAWKFTAKQLDPRIEFGSMPDSAVPTFFVKDNGAGFESSEASKLFTAFQRFHHIEDFPGTGVGLATVHRIIAKHGGEIWAESHPGEGAAFYFTLSAAGSGVGRIPTAVGVA